MRSRDLWLILAAFLVSVLVRVPNLNRPLSAHHEYCTALVMIVLHNWYVDGFTAHHGAPAISFTGPADRYPEGWADGPAVHQGVLYYFSHPPLAYDLPFLIFRVLHVAPNVLGLQLFNILFHLITAICLYLAVRSAWPDGGQGNAPVYAALLYLFMPAPLWFHGNAYMSDMFVQNFWMMHVAVAMNVFMHKEVPTVRTSLLFGSTLFLAVLTSWLGVFAGVTAMLVALWSGRKRGWSGTERVIIVSCIAIATALVSTAWRYTWNMEMASLIDYLRSRLAVRGSVDMANDAGYYLIQLVENYRISYLPVIALCALLGTYLSAIRSKTIHYPPGGPLFIALTAVPVFLDHVFLLQYSHHDFAVLKAGPVFCGMAAFLLLELTPRKAWIAVSFASVAGVLYFLRINPLPGRDAGRYTMEKDIGMGIKAATRSDQAVLFLGYTPEPQVAWYAGRTIIRIDSDEDGKQFLRDQGTDTGVVFQLEEGVLHHHVIDPAGTWP